MFAMVVDRKDSAMLNNLILKYVLPGFIVITGRWKGCNEFKTNVDFVHHWINHFIEFVNEDGLIQIILRVL